MKTKIQIESISGKLLFEFEKKNNTAKDSVIKAVEIGTDLSGADLFGADLSYAYLIGADLRGADLRGADLSGADLRDADFRGADLSYAYLRDADLRDADLRGADLRDADFRGADFRGAEGIELAIAKTRILPEGDIIGYKKCKDNIIVKLKIPSNAKRSHAFGRKCRAEFAEVLEIFGAETAKSQHDSTFIYEVGKIVKPMVPFSENWQSECESGIHFFITKLEAENN